MVGGLLAAMPGMASIAALLSSIIYVATVIAIKLFGAAAPGIAVVVSAMECQVMADARAEEAAHAAEEQVANREILAELRELRAEVTALRNVPAQQP